MAFWIGILVSGLFAWAVVKIGFCEAWVLLCNIVISVYLAIFLRPIITNTLLSAGNSTYGNALTVLGTAAATFLVLHGISHIFFTSHFSVPFPKAFDTIGAALLGFLAGFLVWSFLALLISITPITQNSLATQIGLADKPRQSSVSYICWWCNLVNTVASSSDNRITCEQAIETLLKEAKAKPQSRRDEPSKATELPEAAEPQDSQTQPTRNKPPAASADTNEN